MSHSSGFGIGGFIMGGALGLLGLFLLVRGTFLVLEAADAEFWPRIEGRILTSKVVSTGNSGGRGNKAEIEYAYSIDGTSFRGSRVRPSGLWTAASARASVAKYSRGKSVEIFYNPDDPASAVLEPGITLGALGMPSFGLLFLGGGILFVWLSYQERASEEMH